MRGKSVPREVSPRTIATVLRMKRTSTLSNREIAKQLGIGRSTVDRIVRGLHVSFRENRYLGVRRCACGASIIGPCVQCGALEFADRIKAARKGFGEILSSQKVFELGSEFEGLFKAAVESNEVAAWLLSISDGESITPVPEDVVAHLGKRGVPMEALRRIVPVALEAADLVSRETCDERA